MINVKEQNSEKRLSNEEVIEIIHEFQQGNFANAETLLKECNRLINYMIDNNHFQDLTDWDVQDLCMESFEKICEKYQSYDENKAKFSTWFCRVARNIYYQKYNKNKKRLDKEYLIYEKDGKEKSHLDKLETARSSEEEFLERETIRIVGKAMSQLSENHRKAVFYRDILGYKTGEAAKIMGCTSNNVSVWANRGLKNIKKSLMEEDFGRDL